LMPRRASSPTATRRLLHTNDTDATTRLTGFEQV
jgi:hypothetical protein